MKTPPIPTARAIMTRTLITIPPDMPALSAAGVLIKHEISGAPVVNGDGKLLGIISEFDCLAAVAASQYHNEHDLTVTAERIMSGQVLTVGPDTDAYTLASKLVSNRIRRLPVVENGKLLGQVSRRDVFHALYEYFRKIYPTKHYPDYPEGRTPIEDYPETA